MSKEYEKLENYIGYNFLNRAWLERALSHTALKGNKIPIKETQETLCTLGDAILKAIITDFLFQHLETKGELTQERILREKNTTLEKIGSKWGLSDFIRPLLEGGMNEKGKATRISDTVEAIIGAIYLDRGFDNTKEVVKKWYDELES